MYSVSVNQANKGNAMAMEMILGYLLVVPTLCFAAAYITPWSIADVPESYTHSQAFKHVLKHFFVRKVHITSMVTVFWFPGLLVLIVATAIGLVFFCAFFNDALNDMHSE